MPNPTTSKWARDTLTALAGPRERYAEHGDLWDRIALALDAAYAKAKDDAVRLVDARAADLKSVYDLTEREEAENLATAIRALEPK